MPRVQKRGFLGALTQDDGYCGRLGALELEHVRSFRETVARQCEALVDQLVEQYATALEGLRHGPLQSPRQMSKQSQGPRQPPCPPTMHQLPIPQQGDKAARPIDAALARLHHVVDGKADARRRNDKAPAAEHIVLDLGAAPPNSFGRPKVAAAVNDSKASVSGDEPVPSPREPPRDPRQTFRDRERAARTMKMAPMRAGSGDLQSTCSDLGTGNEVTDLTTRTKTSENTNGANGAVCKQPANRISMGSSSFNSEASGQVPNRRLILFTDMSPECDDECALLYLLSDLNNRDMHVTIDLIMADAEVRFRWMEYLFRDKFVNGKWQLADSAVSFKAGSVDVNLFLLHSPNRESMVIEEFKKKAPALSAEMSSSSKPLLKYLDHTSVPAGAADAILISAPVPELEPEFFERFMGVKGVYVVGTPGGVNCQQPSWSGLLYALHQLAPVVYLSPQFTRLVRFPKAYVEANPHWTAYMKRTIFDMALTCMARRPEIPAKFGDWGLVLRLNAANAKLCQGWFEDVMDIGIDAVGECPPNIKIAVDAYVDRNSGEDRKIGGVVSELRLLGVTTQAKLDEQGKPKSPEDLQILREEYRAQLFKCVYHCVLTTESLIFENAGNFETTHVSNQFRKMKPKSGYVSPNTSLANIFGADEAINILKELPIQALTPAYDMVGAICVIDLLQTGYPDGLGLHIQDAEDSIGKGLFSQEDLEEDPSPHEILLVAEQTDEVIDAVVHLLRSQIDTDPMLIIDDFWTQFDLPATPLHRGSTHFDAGSHTGSMMSHQESDMTTKQSFVLAQPLNYFVVHPASPWRVLWSMIGFLLILYDCVTVPLQVFGLQPIWAMSIVTASYWTADMFQSFSVGYYQGGLIEMRMHRTVRRYLRTWFCIDATIVVTSWVMALDRSTEQHASTVTMVRVLRIFWILRLLKMARLPSTTKALGDAVGSNSLSYTFKMAQMMFMMLGTVHMGACGWYALAAQLENSESTWVERNGMAGVDTMYMYTTCLQWSFLNLLFSPMDINPSTTLERLYSMAIQIGGLIIFSTLLSSLTGFMARMVEMKAEQSRIDDQVRQYFEDHRLSSKLVGQIENYRKHTLENSQRRKLPREQVPGLEELPESLAIRLSYEIFVPELNKHGFFRAFSEANPEGIAITVHRMMKELFLLPSNEVFFRDQVAHHFYIVKEGTFRYLSQRHDETVRGGQWVSELALWLDSWRRKGNLVSSAASVMFSLSIAEFHSCALDMPHQLGRMGCRFAELVARGIHRSEVPFTDLDDIWMDMVDRQQVALRLQDEIQQSGLVD